jgi:hypothetical protein
MNTHPQALPQNAAVRELAELQARMLRPAQNVNMDGGFELGWGTAIFVFGLVPYLNALIPKTVFASPWTSWIAYVPLLGAAFAPYAIPRAIKRFVTWPRTGYVVSPNDLKLGYLVKLMVFGGALGLTFSLPFFMVSQIGDALNQPAAHRHLSGIIWHAAEFLVCGTLVVYLGRKVIRKRPPPPAAYDTVILNEGLKQAPISQTRLRLLKTIVPLVLLGILLLLCAAVLGVLLMSKSILHLRTMRWSECGLVCFLVACNAALYLMANGIAFKQHPWKWLVVPAMLIGPILLAPAIPYPATQPELLPLFEQMPPAMICLGLVWFLSGSFTLLSFVRHNPIPSAENL